MNLTHVRDPYGQAISTLRQLTHEGRFGWGESLVVKDLAEEIGLSPTPVREALACLSGEGLIERRRGKGYFFPALTGPDIIDLYDLDWSYVHSALSLHPLQAASRHKIASHSRAIEIPELGRLLINLTGNESLLKSYDRLRQRLHCVDRASAALGHEARPSGTEIAMAFADRPLEEILSLLAAHHTHRCAQASEVARFLQRAVGRRP